MDGYSKENSRLSPEHLKLIVDSAIKPEVSRERGYRTETVKSHLGRLGFAIPQLLVPGLLIPQFNAHAQCIGYQFRPNEPRVRDGRAIKYESLPKAGSTVDVHPRLTKPRTVEQQNPNDPAELTPLIQDVAVPLIITEGTRKADSAVSRGLCAVSILGVAAWHRAPGWNDFPLAARDIYICFDSDVMTKRAVWIQLRDLKAWLESRKARVRLIYVPCGAAGEKVGLDDWLAARVAQSQDDETIRTALMGLARDELLGPEATAGDNADGSGNDERESQATQLVKLALANGEFFHDSDDCFTTLAIADHRETHNLKSRGYRRFLGYEYFREYEKAPNSEALSTAINALAGHAQFKGAARQTFARIAGVEGRIYLDLGGPDWNSVEITAEGWCQRISSDCPVAFRRAHGMLDLPDPAAGGSIDELRNFLNIVNDDDFKMVVAWLVAALRERGPYPVLSFIGEQGSAKSTATRILRQLVDPNIAALRSEPRESRDLMIAATNGWAIALDNLSKLPDWLSDCICRLSTGGGFGVRSLYTDGDETIFSAERPVVFNSIEEVIVNGDLLDRSMIVTLPRISDAKRETEAAYWLRFEEARPRVLGALLDAVSCALRNVDAVRLSSLPRMADFAVWVEAAAPALGWERDEFSQAYTGNRRAVNDLPLQTAVAEALSGLTLPWEGTATGLLRVLTVAMYGSDEKNVRRPKEWPDAPKTLGNQLRRLAPNLRRAGIEIEFSRKSGRRLITIKRVEPDREGERPSLPALPSLGQHNQGVSDDGSDDGSDGDGQDNGLEPLSQKNPSKIKDNDGSDGHDGKIQPLSETDVNDDEEGIEL